MVTSTSLLLEPHAINVQSHREVVELSRITGVEPYANLGFFQNGVRLTYSDGRTQQIITNDRDRFIAAINEARAKPAAPSSAPPY